jgi:hypothetical protein
MAQNFLSCDRDQPMLLPPDLRDWLDDDQLAWFVIDAVAELDLEPFYASYRADGHRRAAHDSQMMVTLFAYAYAVGERSSRGGAVTEQHAWTVLWFANGLCTRRRVFRDRDDALEAAVAVVGVKRMGRDSQPRG